ncbi:MAG: hypothetical protein WCE75_08780 [Terracidiphilus sp.]
MSLAGQQVPAIRPGEKADILFAVTGPSSAKDESGKPALAELDPIAFVVGGELRGCYGTGQQANAEALEAAMRRRLERAYSPGHIYAVFSGGAFWGEAVAVKSCMDEELDLSGCARLRPATPGATSPRNFEGIAFSGTQPAHSHGAMNAPVSDAEKRILLDQAVAAFATHGVKAWKAGILLAGTRKIQLQSGHSALSGSALYQTPAPKHGEYHSYRLFLVVEESQGSCELVLDSFHKATVVLDSIAEKPKPGEELDEENETDREEFFDGFPLNPGEPDVIVSRHTYYEAWGYSIYRRSGARYKMIYEGCGGGS